MSPLYGVCTARVREVEKGDAPGGKEAHLRAREKRRSVQREAGDRVGMTSGSAATHG